MNTGPSSLYQQTVAAAAKPCQRENVNAVDGAGIIVTKPTMAGNATLTQNDIDVIRERRFGWERATPKQLAAVFGVSVQRINAVCKHPSRIDAI